MEVKKKSKRCSKKKSKRCSKKCKNRKSKKSKSEKTNLNSKKVLNNSEVLVKKSEKNNELETNKENSQEVDDELLDLISPQSVKENDKNENNCYDIYLSKKKKKKLKNKNNLLCDKCYKEKKDEEKKEEDNLNTINPLYDDLFNDYISQVNNKINEEEKKTSTPIIIRIFDFEDEEDSKILSKRRKRKKIEEDKLEEKLKEEEKDYEFEWLGNNINNIKDLIRIGKELEIRKNKKKRYNLNLRKLNKLVEPLTELDNMIGLEKIKNCIFNQIIFYLQELDDKNIDMLHTVVQGPPGVGKTEIAKIMAKIYKGLGFLKNDKIVSVKRDDLVAKYLGQTADKTKKKIEEALGGVLFIDEAYSLGDTEGRDSFSKEALDMLNVYLSEHPHDLICIIAGYKDALQKRFFKQNEGLSRRFTHRFELEKYDAKDLRLIFFKIVRDNKWDVNENEISIDFFDKNKDYFIFNGGDMLTLFSYSKKSHSIRLLKINNEKELIKQKKIINKEDLEEGFKLFLINPENESRGENIDKLKQYTMYS